MVSVKCDMCGKVITNDTERTTFRFPHKVYRNNEEVISDYDICGDCYNKIEEFIKSSHKRCESINHEAPEPDPCEDKTCFKTVEGRCVSCPHFHGVNNITSDRYVYTCTKKRVTNSIPSVLPGIDIEIRPEDFDSEKTKDPCTGKICYDILEGVGYNQSCDNCNHTYNSAEGYHNFDCALKGTGVGVPDKDTVNGFQVMPSAFNNEEETQNG